jgi:hypothetical protein
LGAEEVVASPGDSGLRSAPGGLQRLYEYPLQSVDREEEKKKLGEAVYAVDRTQ